MNRRLILHPDSTTPLDLKRGLLYWDRLVLPNFILQGPIGDEGWGSTWGPTSILDTSSMDVQAKYENDPELQFLIQENSLERPRNTIFELRIRDTATYKTQWAISEFIKANQERESLTVLGFEVNPKSIDYIKNNPNKLLAKQFNMDINDTHPNKNNDSHKVELEIYGLLPVPLDSSYEDILRFKNARYDELLALRDALDEIYLEIINSNDIPRTKSRKLRKLEKTICDLNSAFVENWSSRILSSLKIELNAPNIAANALAGAAASTIFGAPPEIGAALGASSAAIKFELTPTSNHFLLQDGVREFSYVYKAQKEL